jgi:cytoskeleton protein RodZ
MESVGARLKKLRLEKGISLQEAHHKTKIHTDILKAIEEDSFINLTPVYVKGFLKLYAKFLGVDPREYIADYKEPQKPVRLSIVQDKPSLLLLSTSFLKSFFQRLIKIKILKKAFIAILILLFFIGLFNLGKSISSKLSLRWQARKARVSTAALSSAKEKKSQLDKIEKPLSTTAQKNKDVAFGIKLGIRAREDCWLQVRSDGRVVFQNVLKKGRFENWQAKDKIELSVGNAGGIDLEINGKIIPSLGRRGQVLKNILINKQGLSTGR